MTINWPITDIAVNLLTALGLALAAWIGFEIWLIIRDRGKAFKARNSGAMTLVVAIVVAVALAVLLYNLRLAPLPGGSEIHIALGAIIMCFGICLRLWAIDSLGDFFSTFIAVRGGQRLIVSGPYRLVRHPSYTGSLLGFVGFAVALGSAIGILVTFALVLMAYYRRMNAEERIMLSSFGLEYVAYMEKTKRLIPLIY